MSHVLCNYGYVQARAAGRPGIFGMTRAGYWRGRNGSHVALVVDSSFSRPIPFLCAPCG